MRRRDFIGLAGGLAAWPLPAWAQRPTMPLIGYLSSASESADVCVVRELKKGLAELGFVEGNNVAMAGQWSDGDYSKLDQLANELVANVDVIVSSGFPATLAAHKATVDDSDRIPLRGRSGGLRPGAEL
jgi:putative ABC transport system substrate-binding protein